MENKAEEFVQQLDAAKEEDKSKLLAGQNPEDVAAAFFSMEQPRLKLLVDEMSLRQVRRVLF